KFCRNGQADYAGANNYYIKFFYFVCQYLRNPLGLKIEIYSKPGQSTVKRLKLNYFMSTYCKKDYYFIFMLPKNSNIPVNPTLH
ncbi:MAG: hypothetical protein SCJ94_12435, partial [Bacillota bacterium]|nr:hypothetical protein [Bacillota bacterium]